MLRNCCFAAALALPALAQVKLTQGSDRIVIEIGGRPFSEFFIGADTTKPYLHPLRAASGKMVTRQFPMAMLEGETHDHQHHRGVFFGYGAINGINFWENETSYKAPNKGTITVKRILDVKSGKKSGTLEAVFEWRGPDNRLILTEDRTMVFYDDPTLRTIDFDIRLTAPDSDPVLFGDTKEGAFAIRMADALSEKRGGKIRSAEGKQGMKDVWGKRSEWNDYSGDLEGEKVGIALFDHPSNPRHPPFWHSRDYGLFAVNPFGETEFTKGVANYKPLGPFRIEPGKSARFRWRIVIHPGELSIDDLAAMFKKYAAVK